MEVLAGLRPPELVDIPGLRLELAFTVQSFQSVEWLVDKVIFVSLSHFPLALLHFEPVAPDVSRQSNATTIRWILSDKNVRSGL